MEKEKTSYLDIFLIFYNFASQKKKRINMKKAINIDEQISLLEHRGMIFDNKEKAKEILLDVGYYRLGFYSFPYEQSYPAKQNRTHKFKAGTTF